MYYSINRMEILNKLPIELQKEVIKFDMHPVANLFQNKFRKQIDKLKENKTASISFAHHVFHYMPNIEWINEESYNLYFFGDLEYNYEYLVTRYEVLGDDRVYSYF